MRKFCQMLLAAAALAGTAQTVAAKTRTIGSWIVSEEKDRFTDKTKLVAITGKGNNVMAIRCLTELSFTVGTPVREGDTYDVKVRIDGNPVVDTVGGGLGNDIVQINIDDDWIPQLLQAKEVAFRISGTISRDYIFSLGRGTKEVVELAAKACERK